MIKSCEKSSQFTDVLCFGSYVKLLKASTLESNESIINLLFDAIAKPLGLICKNKLPFEICKEDASRLINCKMNVPLEIKRSADVDLVKSSINDYFHTAILSCITKSRSKLLNDLVELIKSDVNITDSDKTKLLEKAKENTLAKFLTNVFLYVVQQPNNLEKQNNKLKTSLFKEYLNNAKNKYDTIKTLLYSDFPRPFYDFYVYNNIKHREPLKNKHFTYKINIIKNSTIKSVLEISPFLIITGTGGIGKSMMMRHLLLNAIEHFEDLKLLPIFITLKDFDSTKIDLFEYIYSKVQCLSSTISKEIVEKALYKGICVLLFDGLDEIAFDNAKYFERELDVFTDRFSKNNFIFSSRPFQSFVSFSRFCVLQLQPFTKTQAIMLIDKLEFRPDQPEIKTKFRAELDHSLYRTHRNFTENPLLLTIMLLTFELFAEVPSKMYIFYREAFLALSKTHDASKGAYKRTLKTGLSIDVFSDYFAEFCFRSYREEKFELSYMDFVKYLSEINKNKASVMVDDFIFDLCSNLCVMYNESGKYYFSHRSFQEYFCALFLSKQKDKFISRLGDFFEKRERFVLGDRTLYMLYDMIPDKIEEYVFVPFLSNLFEKCDNADGYWTFLEEMYPVIFYEHGDVKRHRVNVPKSALLYFIINIIKVEHQITIRDLPFYDSLVVDLEYMRNDEFDGKDDSGEDCYVSDIRGYLLEFKITDILFEKNKYKDMLDKLCNDDFVFKKQYVAARKFLNRLKEKQKVTDDNLLELL